VPFRQLACFPMFSLHFIILWHVDPLLGGDREIGDCAAAVARQSPANNRGMVISAPFAKQQLNKNRGTVFSVWSVPRCYKREKLAAAVSGVESVGD
jgi:hypothetical protein